MKRLAGLVLAVAACGGASDPEGNPAATSLGSVGGSSDASMGSNTVGGSPSSDDATADESSDDSSSADTGSSLPPPLPCDDAFSLTPTNPTLDTFSVAVTHDQPLTFIDLSADGPAPATIVHTDTTGSGPSTWTFTISGHAEGIYTLRFGSRDVATDPLTIHAECQVAVQEGGGSGVDPSAGGGGSDSDGTCTCADKACGEDDGCGTPCSGGHRDAMGAVSDCRVEGNCGCGVEPNDNMVCSGSGMCTVRCSCDCLPPIDKTAAEVAGLDFAGSCALVFEESGDSTVWDYTNGVALCPLGYDPQGAARCTECPPCHRPSSPECEWSQWCTCTAPDYYPEYSQTCCDAGPEHCY